jgi:hypothetical protein
METSAEKSSKLEKILGGVACIVFAPLAIIGGAGIYSAWGLNEAYQQLKRGCYALQGKKTERVNFDPRYFFPHYKVVENQKPA